MTKERRLEIQRKHYNKYKNDPEFKKRNNNHSKKSKDKIKSLETPEEKRIRLDKHNLWCKQNYQKKLENPEYREKLNSYQQHYRLNKDEKLKKEEKVKAAKKVKNNRVTNPKKYIIWDSRARAKKLGLEHSISEDDIEIPEFCPVFNIPIFKVEGKKTDNSFSIDRINNTLGYIKGNIKIISYKANRLKNTSSIEDLEAILKYMKENLK